MTGIDKISQITEQIKNALKLHIEISEILEIEPEKSNIYLEAENTCDEIESRLKENNVKDNYLIQLQQNLTNVLNQLPYKNQVNSDNFKNHPQNKIAYKQQLEPTITNFKNQLEQLQFNFDFFNKLNFFSDNIVAIGANGSGKTSLANRLKGYLQNNGIIVSAQRVLNIPQFNTIQNPSKTLSELKQHQQRDKTYKTADSYRYLNNEFNIVLQNLLADNIAVNNNYTKQAIEIGNRNETIPIPEISKLIRTFSIWNELIEHRIIETLDGINIVVRPITGNHYQAVQMSDGEKVILYLIAQILQAPQDGFIIIDEPEMHLHKTILKKLWDRLEIERDDCIFIYLTHDLDFAVSRNMAKKIWLKSYNPPNNWEIENIPSNELPENLMLELLGSRKTILFCEGEKGKIDENIYQNLFPNYTIMPVGNCTSVINYTRAYNRLPNTYSKAFGIIDADFHGTSEIDSLKEDKIFTYKVAEPENLFLDADFLLLLAKQLMKDDIINIGNIKTEILSKFEIDKELQISNYLSAKINYLYSASHVRKGNTKNKVIENFDSFNADIKIEEWYSERETEIDEIITEKNYDNAILLYNNKGLKQIISQHFKIADFQESSLRLLVRNLDAKNILLKYYPEELKE